MYSEIQAVHLGGAAAMFFFALTAFINFFITKDRAYLYNALWLWGGLAGVMAGFDALPGEVIKPTPFEGFIGFVFYPLFALHFLKMSPESTLGRFLRFFSIFLAAYIALDFVLEFFVSKDALWTLYQAVTLFSTLSFVFVIYNLTKSKDVLSRFFLAGTLGLLGLLVAANILFGLNHPYTGIAGNPYILSTAAGVWDALWFSLGLGYRTYLIQQENNRLNREKLEQELALEQERIRTAEQLRVQIAQDIHDEVGADLSKLSLSAEFAAMQETNQAPDLRLRLREVGAQTRNVARKLNELVFVINPRYDDFAEVQAYFREKGREFLEEAAISSRFDLPEAAGNPVVSPNVKRHLYMLFRECLNNTVKHANAGAVRVLFRADNDQRFLLEIEDNGDGFDLNNTRKFGNGLKSMQSRCEKINAELTISSTPGDGTLLRVVGSL